MQSNIRLFVLLLFVVVPSFSLIAQDQFEGTIGTTNVTIDERGIPQHFSMTMHIKGDQLKIINSPIGDAPGSTMIYRGDKMVVWMMNEEDSSYFEIRQDEPLQPVITPSQPRGKEPVVRKTGKKKEILGYPCEQITIKGNDQETEIWGTKSLGNLYGAMSRTLGSEGTGQGWEERLTKMGYYPLIATTRISGKVVESQQTVKIERKSLPRDLFELPAGFKKQSSTDLMK